MTAQKLHSFTHLQQKLDSEKKFRITTETSIFNCLLKAAHLQRLSLLPKSGGQIVSFDPYCEMLNYGGVKGTTRVRFKAKLRQSRYDVGSLIGERNLRNLLRKDTRWPLHEMCMTGCRIERWFQICVPPLINVTGCRPPITKARSQLGWKQRLLPRCGGAAEIGAV